MGVVFYVRVNNYMSKQKLITKNCMSKEGLLVPFTNMLSCQYFLFRCIQYNKIDRDEVDVDIDLNKSQ